MALVCFCLTVDGALTIPWTICNVDPGLPFKSFYEKLCAGSLELFEQFASKLGATRLTGTFAGPAKDSLSAVDGKLPMDEVCRQFGSFVRLSCDKVEVGSASTTSDTDVPVRQNSFQVLMMNQMALSSRTTLPACLEPRTNKDKLFNELVLLFGSRNWKWCDGGNTHGKRFISSLRDALWYVDGHHQTLEARSCAIPVPFNTFTGYNTPEKSKHRKRQAGNLSADVLMNHVQVLKEFLITSWMQQQRWNELREIICALATVLEDYCSYMKQKTKTTRTRHECMAFSDSDSGTLSVLPVITVVSSRLAALDCAIREKSCYDKMFVNDFCSVDPKRKYQYVQDSKKGLTVSCVMYTASLGSNLGNHLFVWRIPQGVSLEAATVENMRIIDQIKQSLPTYHSRALRREFMNRFGLVTVG